MKITKDIKMNDITSTLFAVFACEDDDLVKPNIIFMF